MELLCYVPPLLYDRGLLLFLKRQLHQLVSVPPTTIGTTLKIVLSLCFLQNSVSTAAQRESENENHTTATITPFPPHDAHGNLLPPASHGLPDGMWLWQH